MSLEDAWELTMASCKNPPVESWLEGSVSTRVSPVSTAGLPFGAVSRSRRQASGGRPMR